MKIRMTINNNHDDFQGIVKEHNNKIILNKIKKLSLDNEVKTFEFDSKDDFEEFIKTQEWIKTINKISEFKSWGGRRPGSGRKLTGRKKVMFYITTGEEMQVRDFIAKIREK